MNLEFISKLEKIEKVLTENLPANLNRHWLQQSFGNLPDSVTNELIAPLIKPCLNLLRLGGKRWRPLFMVLCGELALETSHKDDFAKAPEYDKILERIYELTPLVEFVHTASLIHDDIEDGADMRRGKPAAHITYGIDVALNAGSWLYFEASICINSINSTDTNTLLLKIALYDALNLELRRLHLGQTMDINWHTNNKTLPTSSEYMVMTALKTGTLASLAARIGMLAGNANPEQVACIASLAADIGVGFQILDDVKNITTGNVGKKRGDDIVEGKKSLPVLYHLEQNPQDFEPLMNHFTQAANEGIDSSAVEKAISIISTSTAIEDAKIKGEKLISGSCSAIESHFPNTKGANLIKQLFENMA